MSVVSDDGVSSSRLRVYTSCALICVTASTPRNSATMDIQMTPALPRISAPSASRTSR